MTLQAFAARAFFMAPLFLGACQGQIPVGPKTSPTQDITTETCPDDSKVKLGFTQQDHPMAHSFYQTITQEGVCLADLDKGFRVTNYAKKYCDDPTATFCTKGANDDVITADEVLEYTFNHDQKYRSMIEAQLGDPLPWVLDDLDPRTTFDLGIQNHVNLAIEKIKDDLKTQGIKEGTNDYKERTAVGLFYLVTTQDAETIAKWYRKDPLFFNNDTKELIEVGLGGFQRSLRSMGGMDIAKDLSEEYSALDALKYKRGKCTEKSKILYAMFRMAGLDPEFVWIKRENIVLKDPSKQAIVDAWPMEMEHVCVGLQLGDRFRLFDPALYDSDAQHKSPVRLTQRQYLACDYSNRSISQKLRRDPEKMLAKLDQALSIDSRNRLAYYNRGNIWNEMGELRKAKAAYDKAIDIDPQNGFAYNNRGAVRLRSDEDELDKAMEDFKRAMELNPKSSNAYNNYGIACVKKDELGKAIIYFNRAIKLDQNNVEAYLNRGNAYLKNEEWDKAIADFSKVIDEINPENEDAKKRLRLALERKRESK